MKRGSVIVLAGLAMFLCLVAGRVFFESRAEYQRGIKAQQTGDISGAITHFRRTIQWFLPLNPYVARGVGQLQQLARTAEKSRDVPVALRSYRNLRAALYSIKSFYSPFQAEIDDADRHISGLMATNTAGKIDEAKRKHYLRQLQAHHIPHAGWSTLMVLGFFLWVGAAVLLIIRGFDAQGAIKPRAAWPAASAIGVGLLLWMVAMRLA